MNLSDLLAGLQAQQDQAAARAAALRGEIEHLTAELADTQARIADLATTCKVIAELEPAAADSGPTGRAPPTRTS